MPSGVLSGTTTVLYVFAACLHEIKACTKYEKGGNLNTSQCSLADGETAHCRCPLKFPFSLQETSTETVFWNPQVSDSRTADDYHYDPDFGTLHTISKLTFILGLSASPRHPHQPLPIKKLVHRARSWPFFLPSLTCRSNNY